MSSEKELFNKKRIAKNTLILYIQMFLTMLLQLYVVPLLLRTLGEVDYGIYNVVAGVVTTLSFISGSLSSGAQRFFAYAMGKGDRRGLANIFSSTMLIYIVTSLVIVLILEAVGVWFLNTKMSIPAERIVAANWVFQFSVMAFAFEIIIIPFRATIIAHERMNVLAYITVGQSILRFAAAVIISFVTFDGLIAYSSFVFIATVIIWLFLLIYCRKSFEECRGFHFHWDSHQGKSLIAYSGWNMIGSLALIMRNQGINILQNVFFGPIINAAHSIAQQVQGVANHFVDNVYVASRPQITKLYSAGKHKEMWDLIFQSAKYAFFLMMFICIPAIIEIDTVLKIWLKEVPEYTGIIAKLLLFSLLVETLVNQLISSFQAANKIKNYQITASVILLLIIPFSYFALKYVGEVVILPYLISLFLSLIYIISIIWNAHVVVGMDVKGFLKNVIFKNLIVAIPTFCISCFFSSLFEPSVWRIIYTTVISSIVSICLIWTLGIDYTEREVFINLIRNKLKI